MDIDAASSAIEKLFVLGAAIASGLALIRQRRSESDTSKSVEDAKQASAAVYVNQLKSLEQELDRTRRRADQDAQSARDRENQLREINDAVRVQFEQSLVTFRRELGQRDERIGVLLEDVAEWRGRAENLQAEKIDLQASIPRQKAECEESKRALTAGYERTIASLRSEIGNLEDRNRALVNQLYGDGTATNIMGPRDDT